MAETEKVAKHLEAAAKGKPAESFAALLRAWELHKSEALRETILAADAAEGLPAFEGATVEWLKGLTKARAHERGPYFATLKGPKVADTLRRLNEAASFGQDPRRPPGGAARGAEGPDAAPAATPPGTAAGSLGPATG
ncbi:MAG: hypothetical protein JNK82_11740, partial [Myxococcaceae bacterium]|nr:hypothetical protein [Myxococcaceae bacterium]